jgi:hypothetical protein
MVLCKSDDVIIIDDEVLSMRFFDSA